jgi:hypothetical protein
MVTAWIQWEKETGLQAKALVRDPQVEGGGKGVGRLDSLG